MTTITTPEGTTHTIQTISSGHGHIKETALSPAADIFHKDGLWYAAWVGSARWHNLNNGWPVGGGFRTRTEAAQWLLDGGLG